MAIPMRHSSPLRIIANDRTFFVTSSIWGKRQLLQSDRAADLFLDVLFDYCNQGKYRLHEYVVMPEHFHVLITVAAGMTIEKAVQYIKGGFAHRAIKELGLGAPVWQKGFSETRVYDQSARERIGEYIRNNPVRRGLVNAPEQYRYSSAWKRRLKA